MNQVKKELESVERKIKFNIYLVKHGKPELVGEGMHYLILWRHNK